MKTTKSLRCIFTRIAAVLVTGVTALAFFAFSPAVVYAQDETPPAEPTPDPARLQEIYVREQTALTRQDEAATRISEGITRAESLISKGDAAGLDTSALSAALVQFESSMAGAKTAHESAAAILAAHAGFDASGTVTDIEQARQTLQSAGEALKSAAGIYKSARETLRSAVQSWVEANQAFFTGKMEERHQNELSWLSKQEANIGKLSNAASRLQTLIERGQAKGYDTFSLEAVVADINAQLPQSQAYHDTAAGILDAHAGFNGSGKVMDAATARQTLQAAAEALNAAKQINTSLAQEIKAAVEAWRSEHPAPAPEPTAIP